MTIKRIILGLKNRSGHTGGYSLRHKILAVSMVTILATLMFLHFYLLPIASGAYNNECYLSKERIKDLLYAVQAIGKTMEKHNITYWLDYGTLLGALKYGDILPWDGDADISYLLDDEKYTAHRELDNKYGVQSNELIALYKAETIDYVRWTKERGFYNGKEETMLHKFYPSSVLQNENMIVKYHHKLESFPLAWVWPTRLVDFKGVKLRIPNEPRKLLTHRYPWTYRFGLSVPYKWKCWVPCWIRTANGC